MEAVEKLIARLRRANDAERAAVRVELEALLRGPDAGQAREAVEGALRGELLEVQWELEEVLEATAPKKKAPPPAPAPASEVVPPDPNKPLTSKDLVLVYDDPRGLMLHRSKVGDRWFATQVGPNGQPQTFELHADEVRQVKTQLQGSPYWVLGSA